VANFDVTLTRHIGQQTRDVQDGSYPTSQTMSHGRRVAVCVQNMNILPSSNLNCGTGHMDLSTPMPALSRDFTESRTY
jgi:hypothetical protein